MAEDFDRYDQRRDRCFLDQSSNTAPSLREIVGAPVELQRRYASHPEVADFIAAFNEAAALGDPAAQRPRRAKLAERAEALQAKSAGEGKSELAGLLGLAAECLRGDYPIRPIRILPSVNLRP